MTNNTSKILVLDANQRSALAVVRSLGQHPDLHILTADETPSALAGHSRKSRSYYQHPSMYRAPKAFAQWLINFAASEKLDWIFPATEVSSQSALLLRDQLGNCQLPFAPLDTVMQLADKWQLVLLAQDTGVAVPQSRHFNSSAEVNLSAIDRYPLVIKPCLSRIRADAGWIDTSVHIAKSATEASSLLNNKAYLQNHAFMLQEFIPGHGAGIFALYDRGKPIAFFAHRRIREKPPSGGVSTLSESAPTDPAMLEMARRLLDAAHWHGVAMVEFRVTPNGRPVLMEINTRFWGSLQLAIDAGVDFPYLLYRTCSGAPVQAVNHYRVGKRLRWLLGDVDNLLLTLRDHRNYSRLQRLKSLGQFFTPHPFSTRHEVNRLRDLGPAIFEIQQYIKDLLR